MTELNTQGHFTPKDAGTRRTNEVSAAEELLQIQDTQFSKYISYADCSV